MQIGAVLPHHEIGTDPGAITAYLQGIEALGVTHLLIYDHVLGADRGHHGDFQGPYDKDVAFHEPFTFLAFAAAVTTSVELVPAVVILPQRQTALVAKQAAEVAILSGDRLRLGVGIGWNKVEYDGLNENFRTRGRRMAEQIELLRALWTEDSVTFKGEFDTVEGASINPRPPRTIPIWFGASAPVALERAGRIGDGWMPLGRPDEHARAALDTIAAARTEAGGTMDDFGLQAQAQWAGGTPERWRKHADGWRDLGATHMAIATHRADPTDAEGHVARVAEYLEALR